jgi:hypothetical protein
VFTRRDLDFPTDTSYFRSKLTKGLLFSPTSFMSIKSPTNILLHNSATVRIFEEEKKFKFTAKFKLLSVPVTSFDKRLNDYQSKTKVKIQHGYE